MLVFRCVPDTNFRITFGHTQEVGFRGPPVRLDAPILFIAVPR
jgi:hypothetical protein